MVVTDDRRPLTWLALGAAGSSLAVWLGSRTGLNAGLDVAGLIAAAGAVIACLRAARQNQQTKHPWFLLAAGCLTWFAGTLIDAGHDASAPSARDLGAFLFAIAGITALFALIRRGRPYEREETLAGLLAGVATIAVGFEFLIRPLMGRANDAIAGDGHRVDLALQIAGTGFVLPIAVALAIGVGGLGRRTLLMLLGSGITPVALTALAGGRMNETDDRLASLPAFGWVIGFVLIAAAAWLAQRDRVHSAAPNALEVGAYLRRVGTISSVCALAVTAAAVDASLRPGTEWVIVAMAAACGLLIAARMGAAGAIADRLVQRTRERDRLATVLDLSTTIAGTLEVDRLLPALAKAAAQAGDRTRVEVTLFAPDGRVELRASHGLTSYEETALAGESSCLSPALPDWPIAPTVRTTNDPIFAPATKRIYRSIGKRQVLIAPLRADGRVIGTVELWTPYDERPFAAGEITAATAVGREGGLAIQNARLLTDARARADERAMLLRVTQAATSSLELRTVLAEIAQASLGVAGAECCTILLWRPETEEFEVGSDQTIPEWPGVEEPGNRFPRNHFGSDSIVMTSRRAQRFDLMSSELPASELDHMREMGTESTLVVPLINGDICLGTLNLLSRHPSAFDANAARLGTEIASQTALAIHNANLLEDARQRAEEPATLLQVSRAATSSLELHSVLDEIARATLGLTGVECCAIMLWDPETDELEMGAEVTVPDWPGVDEPGTRYPLDEVNGHQALLRSREPVHFQDDDPNLPAVHRARLEEWEARSVLIFPLWVGEECLGLLQIYSRHLRAFGPATMRLGTEVAAQTALAIHNARLLAETRRHAEEQTALLRVSRAVSSSLNLQDVLWEVARASIGVAGAEGCEIELWHPDTDETELVAQHYVVYWLDNRSRVGTRLSLNDWPLTRRVLTTRQPVIFGEQDESLTEYERMILFNEGTRSGFVVPIVLDDRCLGIFSLYSRHPNAFTQRAVALGQDLAGQAALAIERARLHAEVERRARIDGLTGVLNRGTIEETLDRELSRSRRSGFPLSVLVIDLDGFKQVNDEHGHLTGDRVLQAVSKILKSSIREVDHVGRYGGDEFLVLLPDADAAGATIASQRILAATALARVPVDTAEGSIPIQFSIGQAVYPTDGSTHQELLATADEAMYATKLSASARR